MFLAYAGLVGVFEVLVPARSSEEVGGSRAVRGGDRGRAGFCGKEKMQCRYEPVLFFVVVCLFVVKLT